MANNDNFAPYSATNLPTDPLAGTPQGMSYSPLASALLGLGQGFYKTAQPSPIPIAPGMPLGEALTGASQGLASANNANLQLQQFQMQQQRAAAETQLAQINAAKAGRSFTLGNQLLGIGGGTPGAGAPPAGGAPTGTMVAGGGSAPMGGGAPAATPMADGSPQPQASAPPAAGGGPAPVGPSTLLDVISGTNDPHKLYSAATKIYAMGDDQLSKIADMAKARADALTQSMMKDGITYGDDDKPHLSNEFAAIMVAKRTTEKAADNQQNILIGQGPQGPQVTSLTPQPGSLEGMRARAFAEQIGKDTATMQTAGPIANSTALGQTYGNSGLRLGGNAPPPTLGPATAVPPPMGGNPAVPVTAPALGGQGPQGGLAAPQVGNMAPPHGAPPVAPTTAPPPNAMQADPRLLQATSAMTQAKQPAMLKTIFNPQSGEYGTLDAAHAQMPQGYIETDERTLPPSIKGQVAADTDLRKKSSDQQSEIARQSQVLDQALALVNDPSFKSGKWSDLSLSGRAFLAPFGLDQNTVNTQEAFKSVLNRLTFQEAPTLNVSTVRPSMTGLMGEVQGDLGKNPNANRAAILIGKTMATWDLGRIAAINGSPNATKAEQEYIASHNVAGPELSSAVHNTLNSNQVEIPTFKGPSAADEMSRWYNQYKGYWSSGQLRAVGSIMSNLAMGKNLTGQTLKVGQ